MSKHPTVNIPNVGPMDHAWDLLGEWHTELEATDGDTVIEATVGWANWAEGRLEFDGTAAATVGLPPAVPLERTSDVHLTDAGGGALQWACAAPAANWSVQAMLWPGALHLIVYAADDEERELFRARAVRSREYYLAKYPLEDDGVAGSNG